MPVIIWIVIAILAILVVRRSALGLLIEATGTSVYMTLASTLMAYVIGLPIGILLVVCAPGGLKPKAVLYKILDFIVNITRSIPFLILMLQRRGQKPLEKVIGGLLLFVAAAYIVELVFSQPNFAQLSKGMVIPSLPNSEAVFLAAGVLGATIMPHVIYLHSSLTQHLHGGTRQQRYAATKWDVAIAMTIAGFVNLAMMATAAAAFHFSGHTGVADLDEAYLTLQPLLSHAAATVFGLSLVAAGLSSTVVGTLAGQVVMQGFIRFHIPLWVRRTVTMLPSFIVILMGLDPTRILVMSQVLLSFGIALALVPLLIFTSDSKLMGDLVNSKRVKQTGWVIVVLVVALNIWLLVGTALGL